ncbi:MAG TPA: hypothetical protein VMZ71_05395 [Gemmataceae bacterium]|nr:hypothetical protein [Gemmataceae bacterium]
MPPHRIRLGPPWVASADGTRFTRRFGRPRTLDPGESVWLVCAFELDAVTVNGTAVAAVSDLTPLLQPRNEIVVQLAAGGIFPGEVALEIRSGAEPSDA